MEKFTIKSSTSNAEFIFSKKDGEFFTFEAAGEDIKAVKRASTYTDAFGVATLLQRVAACSRPWAGSESWESLEGDFALNLTCNSTGQVIIQVKLAQWNSGSEDWHLTVHLNTELGLLQQIANQASAFFNA